MACATRLERAERPSRWMAAIVLLVALEYLKVPYPIAAVDILDAYQEVARDRRNVVVMDVPLGWRTGWGSTGRSLDRQQLFQIVHGKRLLGGFASRVPEDELMVTSLSESDSGKNTQTVLPDMDIRDSALQPRYTAVRITQRAVDELSSEGLSTEVLRAIDSIKGRMFVYEVPLFQALNLDSTHKCNSSAGCQESGQPI